MVFFLGFFFFFGGFGGFSCFLGGLGVMGVLLFCWLWVVFVFLWFGEGNPLLLQSIRQAAASSLPVR